MEQEYALDQRVYVTTLNKWGTVWDVEKRNLYIIQLEDGSMLYACDYSELSLQS